MRHAWMALALMAGLTSDGLAGEPYFGPPGRYPGRRAGVSFTLGGFHGPFYPPYFAGPAFGSGFFFAPPPVTTIVIPVQVIAPPPLQVIAPPEPEPAPNLVRDEDFPDKIIIRPRQQMVKRDERPLEEPPIRPLPGQPAGEFRPIPEEERARVQPDQPPMPLIPDLPEKDPAAEAARQVALGKHAFAAREYGRAERRFLQATRIAGKEPAAYFFLAQTRMALGKYREASAAIHDGLRLFPDWPTLPFKVRDLYQVNPDDYAAQLKRLEDALLLNRDDPAVLFLYAYQLWFDDRQAEAKPLFRRAARLVASPFFIDLFLLGQPAGPVARQ